MHAVTSERNHGDSLHVAMLDNADRGDWIWPVSDQAANLPLPHSQLRWSPWRGMKVKKQWSLAWPLNTMDL